jgi:hypothetical protein
MTRNARARSRTFPTFWPRSSRTSPAICASVGHANPQTTAIYTRHVIPPCGVPIQRGLALAATSRLRKPWGDKVAHCLQYEHPGIRGEEKADKECDVAKHAPGAGRADPGEPVSRQRMEDGSGFQQPSARFSRKAGLDRARQDAEGEGGQHNESNYEHG